MKEKRNSDQEKTTKRVHRVGSVTMGLSLIIIGLTTVIYLFFPEIDYRFLAKFSPLILVGIGVEVLLANAQSDTICFKYDLFSGIVCFLLITFSLSMAAFVTVMQQYLNNYW